MSLHTFAARDGARFSLHEQGSQLLSWQPAGADEQLFQAPSGVNVGQAIRGGVPVVFPQFAAQGPLPRHGLVRTRPWTLVEQRQDDLALAVMRCESDDRSLAIWPHAFALELTVLAQAQQLEIELAVTNTGESALRFQAALHSYFSVGDVAECQVEGLRDLRYRDAARQQEGVQHSSRLELLNGRPVDRIVYGVGETPLQLHDHAMGRRLLLQHQGFADAVVWNPGEEHGLEDLPEQSWRRFLCVEAAQIEAPVHLMPGEEWLGRQRIQLG